MWVRTMPKPEHTLTGPIADTRRDFLVALCEVGKARATVRRWKSHPVNRAAAEAALVIAERRLMQARQDYARAKGLTS